MKFFNALHASSKGGAAIEYALIASIVSIAGLVAMVALGNTVQDTYDATANQVAEAGIR